jgi:Zn-dependent protease with chaperone function
MSSRRFYPTEGGARDVPWITLYASALALQLVCATLRGAFFYLPVTLLLDISGHGHSRFTASVILLTLTYGPLVWSLTALVYPIGAGQVWRTSSGGRAPSDSERQAVEAAINEIQPRDSTVRAPAIWFVLDDWELNAAVLGDALMVSTGTISDPGLTAVIAHELGHLNSTDCHLSVALGRLAWPAEIYMRIFDRFGETTGCLMAMLSLAGQVCSGLVVVIPMRPLWAAWFRGREFKADEYAAKLGYGDELADALERHALGDDRPTPFRFISAASHPYTTHRIDALRRYALIYVTA